ncbi:MAG: hypothetical protein AB8I08_28095 [Sandaracinaceae bacterium]
MRVRDGFLVGVIGCGLVLGACDGDSDPDAGAVIDSGSEPMDSGPIDSGVVDSGPMIDAGPLGHCDAEDLILAAVDPGTSITVFNPTAAAIDTSEDYEFCAQPRYETLGDIESGVSIAPGESHVFAWPSGFDDTAAGGEIALYARRPFGSSEAQIDFVCWGEAGSLSRKDVAEDDGDWSGDCAAALTGAITRIPETDGTSAQSYDPTGASAALSCD